MEEIIMARPDKDPETVLDGIHFLNNNLCSALEEIVYQLEEINKSLVELAEKNNGGDNNGWNKKFRLKK
tara:strand:+ start:468 stop:674 length:207 start_codon:yes stop_codon:yes gene_type:complete